MEEIEKELKLTSFFNEIREIENLKDNILTIYLAEFEENIYLIFYITSNYIITLHLYLNL